MINVHKLFMLWCKITLIAVYLLILLGGLVRSTGSGMGCPDWPLCFGKWMPPTDITQLPCDYQQIFHQKRIEKQKKIIHIIQIFNKNLWNSSFQQQKSGQCAQFNVVKAWTEYINRLVGIIVGLLISGIFFISCIIPITKKIRFIAGCIVFLVLVEGLVGAMVVITHLLPWLVTVHMLLALCIIGLLIYLVYNNNRKKSTYSRHYISKKLFYTLVSCLILTIVQIILGSQVREIVDQLITSSISIEKPINWLTQLTKYNQFIVHRSFSIVIILLNIYAVYGCYQSQYYALKKWSYLLLISISISLLLGGILVYKSLPAFAQPLHLFLAVIIFSIQWYIILGNSIQKAK